MGALFLQPAAAPLWDTYNGGGPLVEYTLVPMADPLARSSTGPRGVYFRAGPVPTWRAGTWSLDPMNRFGFVWINSSGGPRHVHPSPAVRAGRLRARRTPRRGGDDPQLLGPRTPPIPTRSRDAG